MVLENAFGIIMFFAFPEKFVWIMPCMIIRKSSSVRSPVCCKKMVMLLRVSDEEEKGDEHLQNESYQNYWYWKL